MENLLTTNQQAREKQCRQCSSVEKLIQNVIDSCHVTTGKDPMQISMETVVETWRGIF